MHPSHQFNGFPGNKVPLLNKTGINTVAGTGLLYVPERQYRYGEHYGEANHDFGHGKVPFRPGVYYLHSKSNKGGFRSGFKFSQEPYNRIKNT
jgi:hypothetical protein